MPQSWTWWYGTPSLTVMEHRLAVKHLLSGSGLTAINMDEARVMMLFPAMVRVVKWCLWPRWLVCLCLFCLTVCALGGAGASTGGFAVSAGELELLFEDEPSLLPKLDPSEPQRKKELEKLPLGSVRVARAESKVPEEGVGGGDSKHLFPHYRPPTSTPTRPPEKPKPKPKPKPPKPYGTPSNGGPPIAYPPKEERRKHKHRRKRHQHKD